MGRNKAIQTFLLTLTGCSWMLLFLSITLSDNHAFRKYHAARQATHAPPLREQDPCALCWSAVPDTPAREREGDPSPTGDTGWGSRLAWAMGMGGGGRVTARTRGGAAGGRVGGVGAFYYYTLHTAFTALRLRLDQAQQVAGDVQEEVAALREKVAQLHHTLTTRFSPRRNPYHQHQHQQPTTTTTSSKPAPTIASAGTYSHSGTKTHSGRLRTLTGGMSVMKSRVFPVLALYPPSPSHVSSVLPFTTHLTSRLASNLDDKDLSHTIQPKYLKQGRTPRSVQKTIKEIGVSIKGRRTGGDEKFNSIISSIKNGDGEAVSDGMETGGSENSSKVSARDVASVVSVVVVGEGANGLLAELSSSYPGLTVHLATPAPSPFPHTHQLRLHIHSLTTNATLETELMHVLQHVVTRYVLVAMKATSLAGLERLVWAVGHLGVWAVGGGLQMQSGEWRSGCLTSHYTHFEAAWVWRQLGTAGGCMLCHALEGPFLALTVALRHLGWDAEVSGSAGQLDLFLRAAQKNNMLAAVCPASFFILPSLPQAPSRADLLSLARRHGLYSVKAPGQPKLIFSCSEVSVSCRGGGVALAPCCRKDLAALVRFTMDTCEAHGLLCELQEGSLLGAVKTGGVLPWERDADITFHTQNFTALAELKDVFERAGYSLFLTDNRWCCVGGRRAGGQGVVSGGRWRGELWSQHAMDSEDDLLAGRSRTRVEMDGSWVAAPSSPGQYVRNRYGVEVYRHAQHWLDTGRGSGWDEYEAGKFLPCPRPTHHACLDHHPPDGNLNLLPLCLT